MYTKRRPLYVEKRGMIMNIFITFGTVDYLPKIKEQHSAEKMVLMQSPDNALLLHETDGETVFNEGKHYEVIDAVGDIQQGGFAVLNNIPVREEGRPIFEYRFSQRTGLIEKEPGFGAVDKLSELANFFGYFQSLCSTIDYTGSFYVGGFILL
jgi:heme oxygenase (mycobilin-producing)